MGLTKSKVIISKDVIIEKHNYTKDESFSKIITSNSATIEVLFLFFNQSFDHCHTNQSDHTLNTNISSSIF